MNVLRNAIITIDSNKCSSCGKCILACKQNIFKLDKNSHVKKIIATHWETCIGCLRCMSVCKNNAIEIKRIM